MADLGPLIVTATTGIVGAGLGLAGGVAVERIRSADARQARNEARRQQLDDFQRETLIAFQDLLGRYARAYGRAWHHDDMEFRRTGHWMATLLGDDIDREVFETGRDARQLVQRVRDVEVRRLFGDYHSALAESGLPTAQPNLTEAQKQRAAQAERLRIMNLQPALEDRIGEVLRQLL